MPPTKRDLRAMQLANNYSQNLKQHLIEYHKLIDTLLYLNESLKEANTQIKYWQKYSETLLFKICFHGLTIHKIYSGLELKSEYYHKELNGKIIADRSSAKVLLRSQLEAFLMYYNIYVNPKTDDEKELRYSAWIYASLYQRQKFPSNTKFALIQKEKDFQELESIKKRIQSLESYKILNEKQKNVLLSSGTHKFFNHWATILKESGYDEKHVFSVSYTHWSTYSHSEGVSAIQLQGESLMYKEDDTNAISDIQTSKLLICLLINQIKKTFKSAEIKYNSLPELLQYDIEFYINLSKRSMF